MSSICLSVSYLSAIILLSQFLPLPSLTHSFLLSFQYGQTPLSIAQRLGYVSVVETLKTVTETTVITETTVAPDEKYKPQNPEAMNETMFSESEDEGQLEAKRAQENEFECRCRG